MTHATAMACSVSATISPRRSPRQNGLSDRGSRSALWEDTPRSDLGGGEVGHCLILGKHGSRCDRTNTWNPPATEGLSATLATELENTSMSCQMSA